MQNIGLITAHDRATLYRAAEAVALLPVADCPQLAAACQHLAQAAPPLRRDHIVSTLTLADRAHRALMAEAAPDRWLPELDAMGIPAAQAMDIVAGLIDERTAQAHRVSEARDVCTGMLTRLAVPA
jgi:hypothetical protein